MATSAEVLAEIRRIVSEELELELQGPVEPDQNLVTDLQLDSLGMTVLAVGLENRFRVKLSEEDAAGISTVEDLSTLVVRRVQEEGAP